jgi:glutaryl-CoA dehydrogenase (non-decarboxylating)
MEADYQMSHLLWLRAGFLKNEGKPNAKETSLAKWQATVRSEKRLRWRLKSRRKRLLERLSGRALPAQLQGRDHLRRHARHPHLMQADWALGLKKEKAARRTLPPYRPAEAREAVAAD